MSPRNSYRNILISGKARVHMGDSYHDRNSEDAQILRWLHREINPWSRHEEIHSGYQPGTLNWFLEGTSLKSWLATDSHDQDRTRVLWCHGKMGMGKTILSSKVVEQLRSRTTPRHRIAIVYCYYVEQRSQTVEVILGTVLAQLYQGFEENTAIIPKKVRDAFRQTCPRGTQYPRLAELRKWLNEATLSCANGSPVLLLDGLDELVDSVRAALLRCLHPSSLPGVKLFMTSRFPLDEAEVGVAPFEHMSVELCTKMSDVECLVSASLKSPVAYKLKSLARSKNGRRPQNKGIIGEVKSRLLAKADM